MGKRPGLDFIETVEPVDKKLIELGIDPGLHKKLYLEPVSFTELKYEQKEEVVDFYTGRWKHILVPEWHAGKIKTSIKTTGMPLDDVIRMCAWEQLHTSGNFFPEGQMVLVKDGRPAILTRSQPWHVPDISDIDKYFEIHYPNKWGLVSGDYGCGYPWIPMLVNGEPQKFKDYDEILSPDDDVIISNYALTGNPRFKVSGASRAAVYERAAFAVNRGIKHCDTCSPLNNYSKWIAEKKREYPDYECTPEKFIEENVVIPLNEGIEPKYYTAVGMHMKYGARSMKILPGAREDDEDSDGHCGFCRYFLKPSSNF
ncbi:MAG: hypothetical protein JSW41_01010 [Candidatus Aenigmatarchaeota archaeon]|nr:MAG: hypothetical protein JSW41_01010 [Candidatus Aenigmarchaeota archaeon]